MRALRERLRRDAGFGMIELAVAMIVLGIVLVGLLPFTVNAIILAQQNSDVGQGNRIVASELDAARLELADAATSCAAERALGTLDITANISPADLTRYDVRRTVTACDGRLATVEVEVVRGSDGVAIAHATTKVLAGAS
ncbi:MAG: type II secretion system protein [Leucobacter sp.]|nr:type II secretion system protein [Leucobacter sp.]